MMFQPSGPNLRRSCSSQKPTIASMSHMPLPGTQATKHQNHKALKPTGHQATGQPSP